MALSTAQVARKLMIGRDTLHRWIREGKVPAPKKQKIAGISVRIWAAKDIDRVWKYKEANYRKGRGRKKAQKKDGNR
jgi:excisionase family DNA binding protein